MTPDVFIFCAFVCALFCLMMVAARLLFFSRRRNEGGRGEDERPTPARVAGAEADLKALSDRLERLVTLLEEHANRYGARLAAGLELLERDADGITRAADTLQALADKLSEAGMTRDDEGGAPDGEETAAPPAADAKADMVMAMYRKGIPQDEIARRLGMPQGAVALIIGLGDKG